ncbi:hypothetical protein FPF71_07230 [Algibacter amylolyticus]|uniref:Uncharacterized protein n=1 Tax=Algibacter amylolyticus TaxID=1608400 RepID=A0A5M7BET7_9FLAO|nr:hypothetical protein [Algibacter amylolyticus]KAA5825695.1 hypothetical protein F2B50_07230 [Algibacter amylolyticus]MBB5268072.1 hypothetical protein [Algibacter amylolyticus]TSJ79993.1 hypothetical protein FPF71_07230 [Algibacter amylolyticus]
MDTSRIIDLFLFAIPTVITGIIAFYFFREHTKNEDGRRRYLLKKDMQINAMPLRLQAYERMALFLERISPSKLLIRITPISSDKEDYESLLIQSIEQEFEHNLSQQIYITDKCWSIVTTSKNATIQLIRKASMSEKTDSANKLREVVLTEMMERRSPSDAALAFIKEEVSSLW